MKSRVPVSVPPTALQSPFAALEMSGLPPGPPEQPPATTPVRKPGRVVLRKETSHRSGKPVIVVSGFADHHSLEEIDILARDARKALGCGGTTRDREIELQGNQPDAIRKFFQSRNFQVAGVS